jgi:ribosomal protein S27AE
MVMWKVKSCPRCGGDTFVDQELDGWYEVCLQCSHRLELRRITEPDKPVSGKKRGRKKQAVS